MRLYTQEQILRLIKLYNTSDNSEKELLKKYVEQALYKYFNHKLKTKKCEDEHHIAAHLESAVMAKDVK
jgi:hypothetical protein